MRDIKKILTSSKNTSNIQQRKGKSFGYQVLGFGSGGAGNPFIEATGGTIVECGNYKTHIFTGPGTFCVANIAPGPSGNSNIADYIVVAGGGGGVPSYSGGAGAGGFRVSNSHAVPGPTTSPLANPTGLTASVSPYTITVGAGGATGPGCGTTPGVNSIFSTITSTGGGRGVGNPPLPPAPGGSGGAGRGGGGTGNTPPVSPPQGNNGGTSSVGLNAQGGGGGAGAAGATSPNSPTTPGKGGIGSYLGDGFVGPTAPSYGEAGPVGSTRYFAGGGTGGSDTAQPTATGGIGGGGDGNAPSASAPTQNGQTNMGGGGGGLPGPGTTGGSGIVMIRYKFQ